MGGSKQSVDEDWPFDQAPNVAAVSDKGVFQDGKPVLLVIHYSEDEDWAFLSGEPFAMERSMVVAMGEALRHDPTLRSIADLPLGWTAKRAHIGAEWVREHDPDV